ncbi:MAG: DUF2189 domain-containing protein [Alphaproteobacteria bacterium]|nr:DUF2189 domain-containing protein [Alphaproteobacteria bacterium]
MTAARHEVPVTIRMVPVDASGRWLAAAWMDVRRAPGLSLGYGLGFVAASFLLSIGFFLFDLGSLILPLAGGFVLMAPFLVVGFYEISRRLEKGETPSAAPVARACYANMGQVGAMGVVLMLVFLVWALLAAILFALFYGHNPPPLDRFAEEILFSLRGGAFLAVGTAVGAAIATGIFFISAFSFPLLVDRPVDVLTAMAVSVRAVRANWQVMFGWAALIVVLTAVGILTFYLGLAVVMPLLGYATWHAYRDVIRTH